MRSAEVDLNRMAVFVAVAEAGSFTEAGRTLGLTKSMVSQHVRRLEEDLGVTLMQRTTRRLSLTQAGEVYLQSATSILAQAREVHARIQQLRRAPSGLLRITASFDLTLDLLTPLIHKFTQQNPRVDIDLIADDGVLDLVERQLDVAIRIGWLADSSMVASMLGEFEQVVCAAPAYLGGAPPLAVPEDLSRAAWVTLTALRSPNRWTFLDAHGVEQTVQTRGRVATNSPSAVRAFLLAGAGVGAIAEHLVREDLRAGRLVRLFPEHALPSGGIYAVMPSRRQVPLKVSAFVSFLKTELRAQAPPRTATRR
ncbi:LysR family transcriptional regulator [Chondromyces apiculatus]|uniref:Transcriptional regulator PtxR n=1 Tax=Chondromyces apiculatus DSM 436 TaxID=1192034 RepID=A0A017T5J9_9BACT|nr:LysR family transcriptional regulator [Chondromyces apiculatus]EYF04509.1 transcriptional regulator PtxR [Chondromyces apiculatus DSM 436]